MATNMKKLSFTKSLSLRLLLLTIGFVFIAEILIYVPSVANFRQTWLEEKIAAANIAILVIEAAPDYMVSRLLTDELLVSTQMTSITRKINEDEIRVLSSVKEFEINKRYDLRNATWWDQVRDAFTTMLHYQDHTSNIEVTDYAMTGKMEDIVIVFNEDLLCHEMYSYSWNIFFLSLAISLLTALFLYYSITKLLIRPVKVITESMISFRRAPEDQTNKYKPEERTDEIGVVMHELAEMQDEIRKALNQKNHLAKLGSAISKINHDLRNMLKSAQLVSEHLSTIKNPVVQKLTPRFVSAIDRAIRLCENTLQYGGGNNEAPVLHNFDLNPLIDEVTVSLGLLDGGNIKLVNNLGTRMTVIADNDQLFRVFMNLCRNALQALGAKGTITINGHKEDDKLIIDICDNGQGIPEKIKENIFQPFKSNTKGGTGLGLAISREIIKAHGGTLELLKSDTEGSIFRIILPHQEKDIPQNTSMFG
jgi:signal transduction histidine kinase